MSINIGLIGGGNITETHARAARAIPSVNIAAIYGTNTANVERLCREYGGQAYQDFEAFLTHRPDGPRHHWKPFRTPRRRRHRRRSARPSRPDRKADRYHRGTRRRLDRGREAIARKTRGDFSGSREARHSPPQTVGRSGGARQNLIRGRACEVVSPARILWKIEMAWDVWR